MGLKKEKGNGYLARAQVDEARVKYDRNVSQTWDGNSKTQIRFFYSAKHQHGWMDGWNGHERWSFFTFAFFLAPYGEQYSTTQGAVGTGVWCFFPLIPCI